MNMKRIVQLTLHHTNANVLSSQVKQSSPTQIVSETPANLYKHVGDLKSIVFFFEFEVEFVLLFGNRDGKVFTSSTLISISWP